MPIRLAVAMVLPVPLSLQVFVQMLRIPLNLLYSIILCACMVGAMVTNNRVFDAGVLIVFGIIGYFLVNNDYPIPPLVLGFVLSSTIEKNFRTAMIATDGSFLPLFQRPIALILLVNSIPASVRRRSGSLENFPKVEGNTITFCIFLISSRLPPFIRRRERLSSYFSASAA